jgi:plastocyanin
MADWLVNIVLLPSGETAFIIGFPGAQQGQPLQADQDDIVSWYNQTNDVHQPWQTNSSYVPLAQSSLSDPIPAGQPSDIYDCAQPSGNPQRWTMYYGCKQHPNNPKERGSIVVTALPTNSVKITGSGSQVSFVPQARSARSGDLINWNNLTGTAHQPWPTDANYKPLPVSPGSPGYLSDAIPAGGTSNLYTVNPPAGNPPPTKWTVYYFCRLHPNEQGERGQIVVG